MSDPINVPKLRREVESVPPIDHGMGVPVATVLALLDALEAAHWQSMNGREPSPTLRRALEKFSWDEETPDE
jgi:hypothetical protein